MAALQYLLNMCMITDVVFAVAVIAVAAGAITEFQLRIGHIGSAADGALVGVSFLGNLERSRTGSIGEGDSTGLGSGLLFEKSADFDPPGQRNHIQNILAKEQEVVSQGDQREQIVGE